MARHEPVAQIAALCRNGWSGKCHKRNFPVSRCCSICRRGRDIEHRPCSVPFLLAISYCVRRFTDRWYVSYHCCIEIGRLFSPALKQKKMGHRRSRAAMQSIAEWLEKLGLGRYAERFAENGIDLSDLRHLTDQDLKDIGVLLGHRRRILAAIAELAGAVPAA